MQRAANGRCEAWRKGKAALGRERHGTVIGAEMATNGADQYFIAMLRWVLAFLIIALIAGVFGFTGIAAGAASIAKVLFFIFLILLVLALLFGKRIWKDVP